MGTRRVYSLSLLGGRAVATEAWSKWFGRHIRQLGISNRALVFRSFCYGFKDALRAAGVSEDVNDAFTGHAGAASIGCAYGANAKTDAVHLRALGLGARVIDVLDRELDFVLVPLCRCTRISAVGQHA